MVFTPPCVLQVGLISIFFLLGSACESIHKSTLAESSPSSLSIYTLSRGKGVPEDTRKVFEKVEGMLKRAKVKGKVLRLKRLMFGLEGETKLCAEFSSAEEAQRVYQQLEKETLDVDLLNLVKEPCQ